MSITCETNTVIPTDNTPIECDFSSSDCIIFEQAQIYLDLPSNSTSTQVVQKILELLINARERITTLENM
jgi:hypothetical protein